MNKTTAIVLVLIIIVLGGIYFANRTATPATDTTVVNMNMGTTTTETNTVATTTTQGAVKEFTLTASNFKYSLSQMKVNKGDKVKITLLNSAGTHDVQVEGYNVGTKVLNAGQSATVEFTADKAGTFEYYCSVGSHRQMGMKGSLIVQ